MIITQPDILRLIDPMQFSKQSPVTDDDDVSQQFSVVAVWKYKHVLTANWQLLNIMMN